jgi:spermidine/putrescine transport system permease protein
MKQNRFNHKWLLALMAPSVGWLLFFFMIPLLSIAVYAFYTRGDYGELKASFTTANFQTALLPIYLQALFRTLILAGTNIMLCLLFGYPVAYYLSFYVPDRRKSTFLLLIILPFWSSYIARAYSLLLLFSENGPVNHALLSLHIIHQPLPLLLTPGATVTGLLYNYLPFMVLSVYIALEKIDRRLIFAARDLGASPISAFKKIVLPLSISGIGTGAILVLVFSVSDYIIPNILGGSRNLLISNVITNQYFSTRNVPLGSALALIFIAAVMGLVVLLYR